MTNNILDNADAELPSLSYAVELQKIAAKVGFDWDDITDVINKIHEEIDEVSAEINTPNNQQRLVDEIGDLLFACTNLARHLNINPEQALQQGNQKFHRRFSAIEQHIRSNNAAFSDYSLEQLDTLWHRVKLQEKHT